MEIRPNEIEMVEQIGTMDGHPVRMVKTVGGFWIALGKPKAKKMEEAIAAGSHPAIVKYNIEKQYKDFQPSLAKSEIFAQEPTVIGFTELLPEQLRYSGYELFSLEKNEKMEYVLTRHGAHAHKIAGTVLPDSLKLINDSKIPEELQGFTDAVAKIAALQAREKNKKFVVHKNHKFEVAKLLKG